MPRQKYNAWRARSCENCARLSIIVLVGFRNAGGFACLSGWLYCVRLVYTGCIYQTPIPMLHKAATVIQRKFRHYRTIKNKPTSDGYKHDIGALVMAVLVVQRWWKPLANRLSNKRDIRRVTNTYFRRAKQQSRFKSYGGDTIFVDRSALICGICLSEWEKTCLRKSVLV